MKQLQSAGWLSQHRANWPAVPSQLGFTAAAWLTCVGNLVFSKEVWPNTPLASQWLITGLWLLTLAGLPQLLHFGWRWLQAWGMPGWLWLLVSVAYVVGSALMALVWLALLAGGVVLLLSDGLASQD
jgi:hypothetical protein